MQPTVEQRTGTMAILSIVAAVASFFFVFLGSPNVGLIVALASMALGIFGLIRAASPRVSGGIISIIGIALGGIASLLAILVL